MSKAEQFREFAEEVFQWSRKANTEAAKKVYRPCVYLDASCFIEREEFCRSAKGLTLA